MIKSPTKPLLFCVLWVGGTKKGIHRMSRGCHPSVKARKIKKHYALSLMNYMQSYPHELRKDDYCSCPALPHYEAPGMSFDDKDNTINASYFTFPYPQAEKCGRFVTKQPHRKGFATDQTTRSSRNNHDIQHNCRIGDLAILRPKPQSGPKLQFASLVAA